MVHVVFCTKNRIPMIPEEKEGIIYQFLTCQLEEMDCRVRIINGMPEHLHLLFRQHPKKSIAEIIKQVKGSSSHWINQEKIIDRKFEWQV